MWVIAVLPFIVYGFEKFYLIHLLRGIDAFRALSLPKLHIFCLYIRRQPEVYAKFIKFIWHTLSDIATGLRYKKLFIHGNINPRFGAIQAIFYLLLLLFFYCWNQRKFVCLQTLMSLIFLSKQVYRKILVKSRLLKVLEKNDGYHKYWSLKVLPPYAPRACNIARNAINFTFVIDQLFPKTQESSNLIQILTCTRIWSSIISRNVGPGRSLLVVWTGNAPATSLSSILIVHSKPISVFYFDSSKFVFRTGWKSHTSVWWNHS